MNLPQTYALFLGILLIIVAIFIVVPAWRKLMQNLMLVRKGIKITGRYHGKKQIIFTLQGNKQVMFSSIGLPRRFSIGDTLPVLYDPTNPYRAEVIKSVTLWHQPLSSLSSAFALILTGVLLFWGIDVRLVLVSIFAIAIFSYILGISALYLFYPASRLPQEKASAYYNKGCALAKQKRYAEALAAYEKAINLDPSHTHAHYNNGWTLTELKRYDEALVAYEQAIELDPSSAPAYRNKGLVLQELQRDEEALATYDQAIELDPSHAPAYVKKGLILDRLKRYQEALAAYDRAIELDPNSSSVALKDQVLQYLVQSD
jgi:tetratricopeptide (TPR) repeat protein